MTFNKFIATEQLIDNATLFWLTYNSKIITTIISPNVGYVLAYIDDTNSEIIVSGEVTIPQKFSEKIKNYYAKKDENAKKVEVKADV
jgi:hypothetical protein